MSKLLRSFQLVFLSLYLDGELSQFRVGNKRFFSAVLVATIAAFCWGMTSLGDTLDRLQLRTFFEIRGPQPPPRELLLVQIDEKAVQKMGIEQSQPLSRLEIARALRNIQRQAPKLILLDLYAAKESGNEKADNILIEALSMGPVVAGDMTIRRKGFNVPLQVKWDEKFKAHFVMEAPFTLNPEYISAPCPIGTPLNKRVPFIPVIEKQLGREMKEFPERPDRINYYGKPGAIPFVSLADYMEPLISDERSLNLKDKIVMVGVKRNEVIPHEVTTDTFTVPVSSEPMFGVEIHATILGNLLQGNWIKRVPRLYEMAGVFSLFVAIIYLLFPLPPRKTTLVFSLLLVVQGVTMYVAFVNYRLFLPGLYLTALLTPISLIVLSLVGVKRIEAVFRIVKEETGINLRPK